MNIRTMLIGLTVIVATGAVIAQQRGPKALVVEPRFDMGYMPQNGKVTHTFWVNNIGTDSLNIHSVQVGCGCTKTNNPTGMLAVNDSVAIDVVFDIGTRHNSQNKTVSIVSNDPVNPSLELAFTGFVYQPNETVGPVSIFKNSKLDLTNADFGKTVAVEFENRSTSALMPKAIIWPRDLLSLEMPATPVPPNGKGKILVKVNASPAQKNYTKSFTVEFNDASKSRYTIPVRVAETLSSAKANLGGGH